MFNVPVFDDQALNQTPIGFERKQLTLDGLFEELDKVEENFPSMPPFEALRMYFLEACPQSIMDSYYMFLLETEQSAREYHQLPFSGGLWDQPRQLLDVFTTIRAERNQYERIRYEQMERKNKKAQASNDMPGAKMLTKNEDLPPRQG